MARTSLQEFLKGMRQEALWRQNARIGLWRESAKSSGEPRQQRESILFAQSLIATLAIVALVFLFFEPTYQPNDDVVMRGLASGAGTGRPSEYLIFISPLVGRLIKRFYEAWPDFYWYDAYLYGCMVLAGASMAFALLRVGTWIAPFFVLAVFGVFPLRPQFTIVAGLCAAASVLLIVSACLRPPERGSGRIWISLLAVACFVLAILTRNSQAWLVFAVCLLVGSPLLILRRNSVRWLWATISLAGVLAAGVLAAGVSISEAQGDSRLREFYEFNIARVVVQEYLKLNWKRPKERAILQKVGWTHNDLRMFTSRFASNQDPFSVEKLHAIIDLSDRGLLKRPEKAWHDAAKQVRTLITYYAWWVLAAGAFITVLPGKKSGMVVLLLSCFVIVATCIALTLHTKLVPDRISAPFVFGCIALSVLWSLQPDQNALRGPATISGRLTVAGLLVAALFLAPAWADAVRENAKEARVAALVAEDLRAYAAPDLQTIHVWWGFSEELKALGRPFKKSLRIPNMVRLSWDLYTPPIREELARFGIDRIDKDMCRRTDTVVIAPRANLKILEDYLAERYGKKIEIEPVFTGRKLQFYRCRILALP